MSRAARPPLQLFSLSHLQRRKREGKQGQGAATNKAWEETEVFTGYFGLACSDAPMQKLKICFLTKSPVAVMKQDWAPASVFALLSHIFPLHARFKI